MAGVYDIKGVGRRCGNTLSPIHTLEREKEYANV
jgi:hypothetical protein